MKPAIMRPRRTAAKRIAINRMTASRTPAQKHRRMPERRPKKAVKLPVHSADDP
jgi:hypothetical protein